MTINHIVHFHYCYNPRFKELHYFYNLHIMKKIIYNSHEHYNNLY
jgi:hypothetical protein